MFVALAALVLAAPTTFKVDKTTPNNFMAVFDAPLGERIMATSSGLSCSFTVDDAAGTASGACSVPLTTINVDDIKVKTEHFQNWATNAKGKPSACKFEVKLDPFPLKLEKDKEQAFTVQAPFTICGRARQDGGKETVEGKALLLSNGALRIRAHIEKFDREAYQIGPKWTSGWLAKVQNLASVVAPVGSVDVSVFVPRK